MSGPWAATYLQLVVEPGTTDDTQGFGIPDVTSHSAHGKLPPVQYVQHCKVTSHSKHADVLTCAARKHRRACERSSLITARVRAAGREALVAMDARRKSARRYDKSQCGTWRRHSGDDMRKISENVWQIPASGAWIGVWSVLTWLQVKGAESPISPLITEGEFGMLSPAVHVLRCAPLPVRFPSTAEANQYIRGKPGY